MVTNNHYRWDFIGLSTDEKPTPATSPKVTDGSTFYCSDTSKLYVYCQDNWYERKPLGGGGGGGSYTAGDGIDITEDVISVDTDTIQEKLTAGTGINITDNVISAISSGVTVLTEEDYNFPVNSDNKSSISLGLLPTGFYRVADNNVYIRKNQNRRNQLPNLFYVAGETLDGFKPVWDFDGYAAAQGTSSHLISVMMYSPVDGAVYTTKNDVDENEFNSYKPIVQSQAPTTSTAGTIGQIFYDNNNQKAYMCTTASSPYEWKEIQLV